MKNYTLACMLAYLDVDVDISAIEDTEAVADMLSEDFDVASDYAFWYHRARLSYQYFVNYIRSYWKDRKDNREHIKSLIRSAKRDKKEMLERYPEYDRHKKRFAALVIQENEEWKAAM